MAKEHKKTWPGYKIIVWHFDIWYNMHNSDHPYLKGYLFSKYVLYIDFVIRLIMESTWMKRMCGYSIL